MTTSHRSPAAAIALAAISFAALSLPSSVSAIESVNLTSDAYSKGASYYETGYGTLDTGRGSVDILFSTAAPAGGSARYMSVENTAVTNYIAFHFKDAYEPDKLIVVNRLYMNAYKGLADSNERRPGSFVLQGANDPGSPFVAGPDTKGTLRASSEGWTDIKSWTSTTWAEGTSLGQTVLFFDDSFENFTPYRYYRLLVTSTGNGQTAWLQFTRLQLHGYAADSDPSGLAASVAAEENYADVTLSCSDFNTANPTVPGDVFFDYSTSDTFSPGSYTHITVGTGLSGQDWSDTIHLQNLFVGTTYYARMIVENDAGGAATNTFTFATIMPWYISGTGSDSTGDGSAANPFRSFTRAIADIESLAMPVERPLINVDEGVYSAANGETFPVTLPSGTLVRGWSASGAAIDREARVIDGAGATVRLFVFSGSTRAGEIRDLRFHDTKTGVPLYIDASECVVSNCLFTQAETVTRAVSGGIEVNGESVVAIDGCAFVGMTNKAWCVKFSGANANPDANDSRSAVIRNCVFDDNRLNSAIIGALAANSDTAQLRVEDSVFRRNVLTAYTFINSTHVTGSCIGVCGWRNNTKWFGTLAVERCQFLGNTCNQVIGAQFLTQDGTADGSFRVANSLFADNVPYNTTGNNARYGLIHSYRATAIIQQCTFIRNFGRFAQEATTLAYNNIFCGETESLVPGNSYTFTVGTNIVYGCSLGNEAKVSGAEKLVNAEPTFVNASVNGASPDFDARQRAYSPGIDAGVVSQVAGAIDLAGNSRLIDNTASGAALPDLGCYESTYAAEPVPAFRMPSNELLALPRGKASTIEVFLANASEVSLPVTATISAPAGLTCPATLAFTGDTASFQCAIPDETPSGIYTIAISAPGIETGLLDVDVVDERVRITGNRLLVLRSANGAVSLPFTMSAQGVVASSDIHFEIVSVSGDGTNGIEWDSNEGRVIIAGESQSDASLAITPGSGVNTVTLRAGTDFIESGSDVFTLTVSTDPEYFAVDSANGSDTTGIGTDAQPFATIGGALAYAASGDAVKLFPGSYTTQNENFPIDGAGIAFFGATGKPEDVSIDGGNEVENIFKRSSSYDAATVAGVTIGNTTGPVADLLDSSIAFSNCVFRQTFQDNDKAAIAYLYRASRLVMADCVATNFASRQCAVSFDTTDSDITTATRTRDRWFEAERCLFSDCRFERACLDVLRNNGSPNDIRLTECTFSNLRMYTHKEAIQGNGANYYYGGIFHVMSGLAQGGNASCWFKADRCRFVACKGNSMISHSHANPPEFTNCLFADMTNAVSMFWGNYFQSPAAVRNCTFVRCSGGFNGSPNDIQPLGSTIVNSILADCSLVTSEKGVVTVRDSILHNVQDGDFATETNLVKMATSMVADPLFRNAAVDGLDPAFDATLRTGSPAIDAGDNTFASGSLDLSGNPRIYRHTVDMGCYESMESLGLLIMVR